MNNCDANTSTSHYSKYCLVPSCTNTTKSAPGKIFVSLPYGIKRRKLWLKAMRRNVNDISPKTRGYVCEDHFNLEEDMSNYIKWKLIGGYIFMKENVVPHIFKCQKDRKRSFPQTDRKSSKKRARKETVSKLLEKDSETEENSEEKNENITDSNQETQNISLPECSLHSYNKHCQTNAISYATIGVQYKRQYFRSKGVQTNVPEKLLNNNIPLSPIKIMQSPKKASVREVLNTSSSSISSISYITETVVTSDQSSNISANNRIDKIKKLSIQRSNYFNVKKCRTYLGIPNDCYYVVELLRKTVKCEVRDIYIVLKKIRTNLPFEYLGDDFGISAAQAASIFRTNVTAISECIKCYIFWPEKNKINKVLPLQFRANYYNVQSIIDCFEIEIDKPSDPVKQTGTWSEYKKANTLKYLISVTPDGFINFISKGFGGRTTDVAIVQKSQYLNILPKNSFVMADSGFKRIDTLLQPLHCTLIRPPSVRVGTKNSKLEVLETKRIAALRIHVERVIRRVREFKILKSHACINNKLIKYIDHAVIIACGFVNLQNNIIKVK